MKKLHYSTVRDLSKDECARYAFGNRNHYTGVSTYKTREIMIERRVVDDKKREVLIDFRLAVCVIFSFISLNSTWDRNI